MDQEIVQEFLAESWESLARLDKEIVDLEKHPENSQLLASIYCTIHGLKGTSGFIGLTGLGALARATENVLGGMRNQLLPVSPGTISLVVEAVNQIKEILLTLAATGSEPEQSDISLIERLAGLAVEPVRDPNAARTANRSEKGGLMKILVVDDVGIMRRNLERVLSQNGRTVITVASGEDALDILKRDPSISVVITDLIMRGMDGIELFKAARRIDRITDSGASKPPAFILMTAMRPSGINSENELKRLKHAVDIGFNQVMLKPIDNDKLIQHLAVIEQQRERPEPGIAPQQIAPEQIVPGRTTPDPQKLDVFGLMDSIRHLSESGNVEAVNLLKAALANLPT